MRSSSSKSAPTTLSACLLGSYKKPVTSDYSVALEAARSCTTWRDGRSHLLNVGDGYESLHTVGYGHRLDAMSVKAARR
jgi:hypothetical protein